MCTITTAKDDPGETKSLALATGQDIAAWNLSSKPPWPSRWGSVCWLVFSFDCPLRGIPGSDVKKILRVLVPWIGNSSPLVVLCWDAIRRLKMPWPATCLQLQTKLARNDSLLQQQTNKLRERHCCNFISYLNSSMLNHALDVAELAWTNSYNQA